MTSYIKEIVKNVSRPRLSGKVSTVRLTEGVSVSRNGRIKICMSKNKKYRNGSYKKAVRACREASEPLFEEQSDAVKVSETLCLG